MTKGNVCPECKEYMEKVDSNTYHCTICGRVYELVTVVRKSKLTKAYRMMEVNYN